MNKHLSINEKLLIALSVLMPFHSIFFAITKLDFLTLWRDVLLLVLFLLTLRKMRSSKVNIHNTEGLWIIIAMVLCSLVAIFNHDKNASFGLWINTLRIYIGAFFVYFVGKNIKLSRKCYETICRSYVHIAVIISVWGIFQMFILGPGFLINIGYGISSAVLGDGFQRNVGVFSSANLMGVFVAFALYLALYSGLKFENKLALLIILAASFLLTFSTSAFIGFGISILFQELISGNTKKVKHALLKLGKILLILLLIIGLLYLVDRVFLDGIVVDKIQNRINEMVFALSFSAAVSNRSTSALIHLNDITRAYQTLVDNPMGIGFSGPTFMLLGRVPRSQLTYAFETSIFTIGLDFGIVVGFIYLIPFIYPIMQRFRRYNRKRVSLSSMMSITLIILYLFLPLISSIELRYYLFLFLGFESNKLFNDASVKRKFRAVRHTCTVNQAHRDGVLGTLSRASGTTCKSFV